MSDKSVMNVRQAAELDFALARAGWTAADVKRLSGGNTLSAILDVVRGNAEIVQKENSIDLVAEPLVPGGFSFDHHEISRLNLVWTGSDCIELYYSESQRGYIIAQNLYDQILGTGLSVLNANVLDYLLNRPHLIPKEWMSRMVYFWGTIYKDSRGMKGVRYLFFGGSDVGSGWGWGMTPFDRVMPGENCAAIAK